MHTIIKLIFAMLTTLAGMWVLSDSEERILEMRESVSEVAPPVPSSPWVADTSDTTVAVRGMAVEVVTTTTTTTVPVGVAADCESWRRVFAHHGASEAAQEFFVDDGILARETGCGTDMLNESTNDSGICQINPIHNRPGWFGGHEFGPGGWLLALHGLVAGENVNDARWVDACITLYNVCGPGPWKPPYSCESNPL